MTMNKVRSFFAYNLEPYCTSKLFGDVSAGWHLGCARVGEIRGTKLKIGRKVQVNPSTLIY